MMKKGFFSSMFFGGLNVSEGELEKLHTASLQLLEEKGVHCESKFLQDILQKAGAKVDSNDQMVYVPRDLVETAIKLAPSSFILYGRDELKDVLIEPGRIYFGMGGSPEPYIWDYEKGTRRTPTKSDMEQCTRLAEELDNIDFVGAICSVGDYPENIQLYHEYEVLLKNTNKPLLYSAPGYKYTEKFIELAIIASGGEKEFRRRPSIAIFNETVSPLKVGDYSEGITIAAEYGVPVILATAPMMGATAPATQAGLLAQSNAEALFCLVLTQIAKAGTPVLFAPGTGTFDMKNTQYTYASPEQTAARAVIANLGKYYDLPTYNLGGAVEAKVPDAEAGAQAMMGILLNSLSGITLTKVLGTMASGLYGGKEMVVICTEIVSMVKRIVEGVPLTQEDFALDVIKEVAPNGDFLTHTHTFNNFRKDFFVPDLFNRESIEKWEKDGKKTALDKAHEKVNKILESHEPISLPNGASDSMEEVLKNLKTS